MGKATLFGDSDTLRRPAAWVVRKLVRLGLDPADLREMSAKEAGATLLRLQEYREANRIPDPPADAPCRGASVPERLHAADDIEKAVADGLCGDRLLSVLEGSLYLLSGPELVRVARGLANVLGGGGKVRPFPCRVYCVDGSGI